jgi:hypothetical protein
MPIRPLIDDLGIGLPGYPTLSVDLKALEDIATAIRQEVDRNLQPHMAPLKNAYGTGVNFGATSRSENMRQARSIYHDCLVQTASLLTNCVAAGDALASAIDEVGRQYGASDAMAEARAADVAKLLDQTMGAISNPNALRMTESPTASAGSDG